ncbi:hypothetical protein ACJ72_08652 [Emergomyces africanus]|uniref:Uncharacterized protein n=1 Tax=Emergomyces africanus TaxID=1955775 RepID=A0A1B7NJR5_9EURO|nr:hypothetical protein ACJ72_08652 [Emergomyces africanus]
MIRNSIYVDAVLDGMHSTRVMIDLSCILYDIISSHLARKLNLQCMKFPGHLIEEFDDNYQMIDRVACTALNVEEHIVKRFYFYMIKILQDTDSPHITLEMPWLNMIDAVLNSKRQELRFHSRIMIKNTLTFNESPQSVQVSAASFEHHFHKYREQDETQVFSASLKDIEKALEIKKKLTDSQKKLSKHYHAYLDVFDHAAANILLPHCGQGIDHEIVLKSKDEKKTQSS